MVQLNFNVTKLQIKNQPKKLFLALLGWFCVLENFGKTLEKIWKFFGNLWNALENLGKKLYK